MQDDVPIISFTSKAIEITASVPYSYALIVVLLSLVIALLIRNSRKSLE